MRSGANLQETVSKIRFRKLQSWHLLVQNQYWKHQNKVKNLFQVNSKDSNYLMLNRKEEYTDLLGPYGFMY